MKNDVMAVLCCPLAQDPVAGMRTSLRASFVHNLCFTTNDQTRTALLTPSPGMCRHPVPVPAVPGKAERSRSAAVPSGCVLWRLGWCYGQHDT